MNTSDLFGPELEYIDASYKRLLNSLDLGTERVPIAENIKNSSSQEFSSVSRQTLFAVMGICLVIMIVFVKALIAYRRKSKKVRRCMQAQMDILELGVAAECKEAFAELQTDIMTDLSGDLASGGIPFLNYRTYAMHILFPNMDHDDLFPRERSAVMKKQRGLHLFEQLIMNKTFLLLFIRTIESKKHFPISDKAKIASLIMVALQDKMEYCTEILKILLEDLIEKCMTEGSHPKLLLRRTESIAEKMLSSWFAFLLYPFLRECAGDPLFSLFRAIKQQIDKGPVDAITSEARYCLSEENFIRQVIDFKPMTVYVSILQQAGVGGIDPNTVNVSVKVLDCDTISQVKEKVLDTIYRATPYSKRPSKDNFALVWKTGTSGKLILYDDDGTTEIEGDWKKTNTLRHYRVPDGASLNLESWGRPCADLRILSEKNANQSPTLSELSSSSPAFSPATSTLHLWHLVKNDDSDAHEQSERSIKMVPEIYLTRLLATKATLQKFVDNLFETIFSSAHRGSALPIAIKYMFDFLDGQALKHNISDPDVVHRWKSNALPLRFWVNLIENPHYIFDIEKSPVVHSCLTVVAKTFTESCSTDDYLLGKHSRNYKLLYAKELPIYRDWIQQYYSEIKSMNAISNQDMNDMFADESRLRGGEFYTRCALDKLYEYAAESNEALMTTLTEDDLSFIQRLGYKFQQVCHMMATHKKVVVTDL